MFLYYYLRIGEEASRRDNDDTSSSFWRRENVFPKFAPSAWRRRGGEIRGRRRSHGRRGGEGCDSCANKQLNPSLPLPPKKTLEKMTDVTSPFSEKKRKNRKAFMGGQEREQEEGREANFVQGKKGPLVFLDKKRKRRSQKVIISLPKPTSSSTPPPPPSRLRRVITIIIIFAILFLSLPLSLILWSLLTPIFPRGADWAFGKMGEERWIGALPILQPASKLAACLGPSHLPAPLRASSPFSFSFPLLFPQQASSSCPKLISNALVNMQIAPRRPKGGREKAPKRQ